MMDAEDDYEDDHHNDGEDENEGDDNDGLLPFHLCARITSSLVRMAPSCKASATPAGIPQL